MHIHLMIIVPVVLGLLGSLRPEEGAVVETIDEFLVKRIVEDERRAVNDYNRDLSQLDLERIRGTCRARRQMVTLYRSSKGREEAAGAYGLIVAIVAELYSDHSDYQDEWRPMHIIAAGDTPSDSG